MEKIDQSGGVDAHRIINSFVLTYNGSEEIQSLAIGDDECEVTLYYDVHLKDDEESSVLNKEYHLKKVFKKSDSPQTITEKLIELNEPSLMNGDPKFNFIKTFKALPGEHTKLEVMKNGVDIHFFDKVIEDGDCQKKLEPCGISYSYVLPPLFYECTFGDLPPTPTPTPTPTPVEELNYEVTEYGLTFENYQIEFLCKF